MSEENQIVNRVTNSPLVTLDLEDYYVAGERRIIDIKDQLFQELILREQDFRAFIKEHDWSAYKDQHVALTCTVDAIIPTWAYMLIAVALSPYAKTIVMGTRDELEAKLYSDSLKSINWEKFRDAKVVVKGCSHKYVPPSVYVEVSQRLTPLVASLMFGEPCSTVPLFKRRKV